MFATDFEEGYINRDIVDKISTLLLMELKRSFNGWIVDIDKAVALYSHALNAILKE